jgi:uncharacterized protein (DUF1778 family)
MATRPVTARLESHQLRLLEAVAAHEGCSRSDVIRRAVVELVRDRLGALVAGTDDPQADVWAPSDGGGR